MKDLMPGQMLHHLFQRPLIRTFCTAGSAALEQHGEIFIADTLPPIADAPAGHADCVAFLQKCLFPKAERFKSLLYPLGLNPAPENRCVFPAVIMADIGIAFKEISIVVSFCARVKICPAAVL